MSSPDILYVLSHGFAGRMVMHSELLPELAARGVKVALMAANADEPYFRSLCDRRGVEAIRAPSVASLVLSQYAQTRRYLFEDFEKNAALRSKHLWEWNDPNSRALFRLRSGVGKVVNNALLRAPAMVRGLEATERWLLRSATLKRELSRINPKLLVSTYPVAWLEALSVLEAQRLDITTVGHLLSWDNITCKGRFAAVPDHFVSWGPIMSQELREHYGVRNVIETGVAHFDLHVRPVDKGTLAAHLRALGLDPARPYLFVGMSAGYFAPHEIDIVAWLSERVRAGAFGPGTQLLVRPHPQNMRGPMADQRIIARLREIEGGPVAVDLPGVISDGLDMAEGDMARLAALLSGAAVTLNSGSTLTIDSLIHDRPVVLTLFDADRSLPWWQSARRLEEFPHLAKLLSYGGIGVARSFEDLESLVVAYLRDPARDRDARRRALEAECGLPDGGACARIADGLTGLVRERTNRQRSSAGFAGV